MNICIIILALFLHMNQSLSSDKIKVITTLYPQYDFTRQIGDDKVEVSLLLPPGVESHSFEPKPQDIFKINKADILIYTSKYMEPWIEDILKGITNKNLLVIDVSRGINFIGTDPHIWLDFDNVKKITQNIVTGLIKKDSHNQDFFFKNAEEYNKKLTETDEKFKKAFSNCRLKTFVFGGHFAFGYFVKRYNLNYISPYKGFSPDAEPTPKALIHIIKILKSYNIKVIYYEELLSSKFSEVLSKEVKVELLPLNAAHNVTDNDLKSNITFLDIMNKNLVNLKKGLECR